MSTTIELSVREEQKNTVTQPIRPPQAISTRDSSSAEQPFAPAPDVQVARVQQRWNEPGINKYRLAATFVSFAVVGASDGVYGVSRCKIHTETNY